MEFSSSSSSVALKGLISDQVLVPTAFSVPVPRPGTGTGTESVLNSELELKQHYLTVESNGDGLIDFLLWKL